MIVVMDELWVDQYDCIQIFGKLVMLELCVLDLKGKFLKEMVRNVEFQEVIVDVKRKYEEVEINLMCVKLDYDRVRSEIEFIFVVKLNQNVIIEEFLESFMCF